MVLNLLYFYVSTFRSMCCAVPNMAVSCSSLTSRFPGMLLTYFLNDFEIVPVAPIITGITFLFTFHMRCISIIIIIIIIFFYVITFRRMCAVHNMAVFCSSLTFRIIIIIIMSFMQGIYTYIPETNCVPREYSVAAILLLLFMVLISLVSVLNLL